MSRVPDSLETDPIQTRRHWIVLVRWPAIGLVVLAIAFIALHSDPRAFVKTLHLTTRSPLAAPVTMAFKFAAPAAALCLIAAGLVELFAAIAWNIETITIDGRSVDWTVWPSRSESLAIASIADVRWRKSTPGALIFGYGTLVLDGGRQEETITCVPHVAEVAQAIRSAGR